MVGTPGTHGARGTGTSTGRRRVRLPEHGAVAAGLGIGLACLVVDRLADGALDHLLVTVHREALYRSHA